MIDALGVRAIRALAHSPLRASNQWPPADPEREIWNIRLELALSIRPDARELDYLAPLVRFFGDELNEIEGRA